MIKQRASLTKPRLVQIRTSPWSEKARWALEHHGVAHRRIEYVALVGEPRLRLQLGRLTGPAMVPALLLADGAVTDSYAIARHAERHGVGEPLFLPGQGAAISHWNRRSEVVLDALRALATKRAFEEPDALREAVPSTWRWLGPGVLLLGRLGARFIQAKYGIDLPAEEGYREVAREELVALRRGLGSGPYLLDSFSYADIAMSVALQLVAPAKVRHLKQGPASQRISTDAVLCAEFPDLLSWRDRIYRDHRP